MATFTVNGQSVTVEKNQKLIRFLRDTLHLTSVKDGCSEGACGTCHVLIDGKPTKACIPQTDRLEGRTVLTVEGLSDWEKQVYTFAFGEAGAVQCGFCIPGMVISAKGLLDVNPDPTREEAAFAIRNNICRCTGYVKIIDGILLAAKIFSDADKPMPLYYRTTEEMLDEFSYLGAEKAHEVVVTNTNAIADSVEVFELLPKDLYPPKIENSAQQLKDLVYGKMTAIYGEHPPKLITDRVETELHDILSRGYDVIYMSAQKLVANSLEHGYLVGSRGSVGSSLVAYFSGITEVNSLPPHYVCPQCKYTDFDSGAGFGCGADMPLSLIHI